MCTFEEPTYMVDSDERVEAHLVKVPFLSEDTKVDMFQKHTSQPELWTIPKLSQSGKLGQFPEVFRKFPEPEITQISAFFSVAKLCGMHGSRAL